VLIEQSVEDFDNGCDLDEGVEGLTGFFPHRKPDVKISHHVHQPHLENRPLRYMSVGSIPSGEPTLQVFGRLSRGVSSEQAQAELNAVGLRTAADSPETHEHLRPQLVPYAWLVFDPGGIWLGLALGNAFVVMLIVLVCANVTLLMFARAATRENEIAVRSALGASRARIVTQLFVEALVLAGVAVAVGLVAARVGLRSLSATMEAERGQPLPFWMGDSLTPTTVIYAGTLTILTAVIIGVLPALKVTRHGLQDRLRQSTAGGGGFRFGVVWTAVIASQIAATLMFPATALLIAAYSALMMVVCLLACVVPTRRALRVEPARVLTVEG